MGQKKSRPKPVLREPPDCKVVVHGNSWISSSTFIAKVLSKDKIIETGWGSRGSDAKSRFSSWPWFNGGRTSERVLIRRIFNGHADVLLYHLDVLDPDSVEHSKIELLNIMRDEILTGSVLVIFIDEANTESVLDKDLAFVEFKEAIQECVKRVHVVECNSLTGEGMDEAMSCVISEFSRIKSEKTQEFTAEKPPEIQPTVDKSLTQQLSAQIAMPAVAQSA